MFSRIILCEEWTLQGKTYMEIVIEIETWDRNADVKNIVEEVLELCINDRVIFYHVCVLDFDQ